jgi:putative PIN family toxin of toxin-antitoxin system
MNVRVVLDTHIFISSFFGGMRKRIIKLWKSGQIILCLSDEILEEYLLVLSRFWFDWPDIEPVVNLFKEGKHILRVVPKEKIIMIRKDKEDNKFLECAVAGGAIYIISADQHLLRLKKYRDVQIISPLKSLKLLEKIN